MSTNKKLLTIFGATGNQGGSIIKAVLDRPDLQNTYSLRGITRDPSSPRAQNLVSKGVEMVQADLDDVESLKRAVRACHGVFGVTDFWASRSKAVEMQQGTNIFEACKAEGVKHFVWSSLPNVERLTRGVLKHVDHFDSKALVQEKIEREKGEMLASYFMPAQFITFMKSQVKLLDGTPTISLPFPSAEIDWPLFVPQVDAGLFVMGLFEGGAEANGAHAHAVSAWTTPREVVSILSKEIGREVRFNPISAEAYQGQFADEVTGVELTETMRLVGEYNYFGKGEREKQGEYDHWLLPGARKTSVEKWVRENGPWKFE